MRVPLSPRFSHRTASFLSCIFMCLLIFILWLSAKPPESFPPGFGNKQMELIQICLLKELLPLSFPPYHPPAPAGCRCYYPLRPLTCARTYTHTDACAHVPLINWLSLCEINVIMQGGIKKKWHSQQKNNMNIKYKIVFTFSCCGELYLTVSQKR